MGNRCTSLPAQAPVEQFRLSEELRELLLDSLPDTQDLLREAGFEECVDHPELSAHHYMEGYSHALAGGYGQSTRAIHPRYGYEMDRPCAPAPLFAFCEAFRRANAGFFGSLAKSASRDPSSKVVAKLLERGAHLADLSVQVHWGEEVPSPAVAWHVDAPNSLLHMAVGLSGRRALHARRDVAQGRISRNCLVGTKDEREVLWQDAGSVYVSTPSCFPHAVQYTETPWEDRIVAVQCRFLLEEEELIGMIETGSGTLDPSSGPAQLIFRRFQECKLRIPEVQEVRSVLAELEAQ